MTLWKGRVSPLARSIRCAPLLAAFVSFSAPLLAQSNSHHYSIRKPVEKYGTLKQGDVPGFGAVACGPVSVINSFVYLQNQYPHVYDSKLILKNPQGATEYDDWAYSAWVLGTQYMYTNSCGTLDPNFAWGKQRYISTYAPRTTILHGQATEVDWSTAVGQNPKRRPAWMNEMVPTWGFLYEELRRCQDVEIGLIFGGGGGHWLTLTGFDWMDDGDGIIQQMENATIWFIDPDDGMESSSSIWQDPMQGFRLTTNYGGGGGLPSWINIVAAESPVPEPTVVAFAFAGGIGFVLVVARRRRAT